MQRDGCSDRRYRTFGFPVRPRLDGRRPGFLLKIFVQIFDGRRAVRGTYLAAQSFLSLGKEDGNDMSYF
jgi:hypothetical protein